MTLLGSGNFRRWPGDVQRLNLDLLPEDPDTRTETAKRLFVIGGPGPEHRGGRQSRHGRDRIQL